MVECKICNKEFRNKYGLGGHITNKHNLEKKVNGIKNSIESRKTKVEKICPKCNKSFYVIRMKMKNGFLYVPKKEKAFCSRSCANSHIQTEEQNIRRKEKLKGVKYNTKNRKISKKRKSKKEYFCISCGKKLKVKRKTETCIKCFRANIDEINKYRSKSTFRFNVYDYPNEFDLKLIEEFGWYSASNRGNNKTGISRDHMISISYGYRNNIIPFILSHPANCKLILHTENNKKNSDCSITIEELCNKIKIWEKKHPGS